MFMIESILGIILGLAGYFWFFRNKPKNKRIIYSILLFLMVLILRTLSIFIAVALNGM